MEATDPAGDSSGEAKAVSARAPSPHSSTSQAFHPELEPAALKRSMIVSALGSTVGMAMFGVVQGTVINFFMEDLSLKERIPWFTGIAVAGGGRIRWSGSWLQERWGHRRALMISCCGLSRLVWLFMGLLPFIWPEKVKTGGLFGWISACIVFFYFVHSVGANAWLTWMSDLVPPEHQSRYWSLRQVATYTSNAAARLGFGWYLEQHRDMGGYALIFGLASLAGVLDVSMYSFRSSTGSPNANATRKHSILRESLSKRG